MTQCIRNAVTHKSVTADPVDDEYFQYDSVTLSIRNVARMFEVSTLTLWIYELRGLVRRERVGRQRVYSWKDCERIALIVKARKAGLGIAQLDAVIEAMDESATAAATRRSRHQCQALIRDLEAKQQTVADARAELDRIHWESCERLARHIAKQSEQDKNDFRRVL